MKTVKTGGHAPVAFNPRAQLARELKKPAFRRAYKAIGEEFSALDALLEASLSSRTHSPSLATLRKYAQALGRRLEIRLVR